MGVPQYTTPTFQLTFTDQTLDLTEAQNVYVTFKYKGGLLTKTGNDLTVAAKSIAVSLAQKETGMMPLDEIEIQANWTTPSGSRASSEVVSYQIGKQLLQKVVE